MRTTDPSSPLRSSTPRDTTRPTARPPVGPSARRRVAPVALLLALLVSLPGARAGAVAGGDDASQAGEPALGAVLNDARLSPALGGFTVDGAAYRAAYDAWSGALREIADDRRTVQRNRDLVADLAVQRADLRARLDERRVLLRGVVYDLDGLDIAMSQLVVASYTRGGPAGDAAAMFDVGDVTDKLYAQMLEREVGNDELRRRASLHQQIDALQTEIATLTTTLGDLADRAFTAATAIEENTTRVTQLTARVPALEAALRDARLTSPIVGTDLPLLALDAYVRAAAKLATEKPQCAINWTMIAALGRIESRHGNINGATLRPDGRPTVRIVGIALTGDNGTALVPDTDGGAIDGDADLDRAVGPMQFIPSTWTAFRRDGNGDGVTDPQNIYDAALAAATYLCSSGRSLASNDNLRTAYLAYNRSSSYVADAFDNIATYRALAFPPAPPRP
jgi:membrane-bound lytic murein transglycosylase B